MPFSVHNMAWSGEHRAFVVEEFIANGGSPIATAACLSYSFRAQSKRSCSGLKNNSQLGVKLQTNKFCSKKNSPGTPRSATGSDNVAAVRAAIEPSPRRPARKHAIALKLSERSVRRMLHRDLKMYPYKMLIAQEVSDRDFETRVTLCQDLLWNVPRTAVLLFSDEAHFHLSGSENKQNFRYWRQNNPREVHQRLQYGVLFLSLVYGVHTFLKGTA